MKELEQDRKARESVLGGGWLERRENAWKQEISNDDLQYKHKRCPSPMEASRESSLADWLGEERAVEVSAALRPEPLEAGAIADAWLKSQNLAAASLLEKIREHWADLAGEAIARVSKPVELRNGALIAEMSSPAFKYFIDRLQEQRVLANLKVFTQEQVCGISFVIGNSR